RTCLALGPSLPTLGSLTRAGSSALASTPGVIIRDPRQRRVGLPAGLRLSELSPRTAGRNRPAAVSGDRRSRLRTPLRPLSTALRPHRLSRCRGRSPHPAVQPDDAGNHPHRRSAALPNRAVGAAPAIRRAAARQGPPLPHP